MAYKNQAHYQANKQYYAAKAREHKEALKQLVRDLKDMQPCTDCGVRYPYYVMDFDHLDDKVSILADIIKNTGSRTKLLAEIEKCELVCSNCHRIRTHVRRCSPTDKAAPS